MRGISFSLSLYLFLSIMIMDCIYFLDGSRGIKRWRAKQQRVRGDCEEGCRNEPSYFVAVILFLCCLSSKQLSRVPEGVGHWKHCNSLTRFRHTKRKHLLLCTAIQVRKTKYNSHFAYLTEVSWFTFVYNVCLSLCICTALVILDLAEIANTHIIQIIITKVTMQLIVVFRAVLSGCALYSVCGWVCAC